MAAPITLRDDFDGPGLRRLAKATKDAAQARRLLALAEIYDAACGARRRGSGRWIADRPRLGDPVQRARTGRPPRPQGAPGRTERLNADQRRALAALVESGPIPAVHGVVRWRLRDLVQWIWEEFRIGLSETTVSRELKALGFRKLSARPRHYAQNEAAMEDFKKACPPS
jgi:transposase